MKKLQNLLKFSVLTLIVLAFAACGKTSNSFDVIPKDATAVVVVNGKSLAEKSGIDNFTKTNTYQLLLEDIPNDEMEQFKSFEPLFENTDESGIDFKNDYFFFSYKKENTNYMCVYFNLLDVSKFENTVNKINETDDNELSISKEGNFSYLYEEDGEPILFWNDKQLIFLIATNDELTKENYLAEAKGLLTQTSENSINDNEDFTNSMKDQKDINFWMDYAVIYDNMPPMQKMMIQSNMPYDMAGTTIHAYMDFQKGKMIMNYDVVMNEEMKKFLDDNQIIKDKFDTDLLSVFPEKSYANFSLAIDFLGYFNLIKDVMEESQQSIDQYDPMFKAQTGMTIKEALNEFSGEMSYNVHRIAVEDVESTDYMAYYQAGGQGDISDFKIIKKTPKVYYSVALEMNSDKLFNVVIQNLNSMATKTGDYYTIDQGTFKAYFGLFGKNLVFTNDPILIEDVATGKLKGKSLKDSDIASHLKDFPTYAFADFDMDNYPEEIKDALNSLMGEDAKVFNNLISSYKKFEIIPESMTEAKIVLWMKDDSKNSLEVMLKGIDDNIQALAD